MIITRLQGGLGNQLFQYAAAKALSLQLNIPFKLDTTTSLQKDKKRTIALQGLKAKFELATKKEIKQFVLFPSLYRHQPAFFSKFGKNIYREPHFHFDKNFFHLSGPVFLDGFWQSPLYFRDIEPVIREDFTIKEELIKDVIEKARMLETNSSVAVHIRRGDFLNPKSAAYHGLLDAAYYEKGIETILQKHSGASFYFFSDDIEWVKKNLDVPPGSEFVSSYTRSAMEDFYLMTKCRHNIIANSSFSWWPAWINNNPGKMVIAPVNWFADPAINTGDLIPADWIRI